jgi:hypothetical protein
MAHAYRTVLRDDGRWEHKFSQSWLNELMRCPELAHAYLRRDLFSPDTDSTVIGKSMHSGIECILRPKLAGEDWTEAEAHDVVEYEVDRLLLNPDVTFPKYRPATVYERAHAMLDLFIDEVEPHVQPERIEWHFDEVLHEDSERVIRLKGYLDCADTDHVVWDWKQGERDYEVWEKQRFAVQPTAYTFGLSRDLALPERRHFRYAVLLHRGEVQYVDVWRTERHVDWLRQQSIAAARLIEADVKTWPLNDQGWHCSPKWCPIFSECKGQFVDDDWQVSNREHGPVDLVTV